MKWYFIGTGIALTAMFVGMAVDDWSKNTAKRDITVACYNSGKPDCEKLWGK